MSGHPSRWPADPGGWITPRGLAAAWIAEHDGLIAGHVALVRGVRLECLLQATGLFPGELGGIARLYVDPPARRRGLGEPGRHHTRSPRLCSAPARRLRARPAGGCPVSLTPRLTPNELLFCPGQPVRGTSPDTPALRYDRRPGKPVR
jgi:GNAT superfamily N-acetyltransferase